MEGGICKGRLGASTFKEHPLVTVITTVIIDGERKDDIIIFTINRDYF